MSEIFCDFTKIVYYFIIRYIVIFEKYFGFVTFTTLSFRALTID